MVETYTVEELRKDGYLPLSAKGRVRYAILEAIENNGNDWRNIFPGFKGIKDDEKKQETIKKVITEAIAGHHVLNEGRPGGGKTYLGKQIAKLVSDSSYGEIYYVETCRAHCDPAAFYSTKTKDNYDLLLCPGCRKAYQDEIKKKNFEDIPVVKTRLREGIGYQQVRGLETDIEDFEGSINLVKLEEKGSIFDPEVFDPGKVFGANRGILIIDQVEGMDENTQYALLDIIQENKISLSRGKISFPIDIWCYMTSNNAADILPALNSRIVNIHWDYPSTLEAELEILDYTFSEYLSKTLPDKSLPIMPLVWRQLAVYTIQKAREQFENEEDIVIGLRETKRVPESAVGKAIVEGRDYVTEGDVIYALETAIMDTMTMRDVFDDNKKEYIKTLVKESLDEFRKAFCCSKLKDEVGFGYKDLEKELNRILIDIETQRSKENKVKIDLSSYPNLRKVVEFCLKHETIEFLKDKIDKYILSLLEFFPKYNPCVEDEEEEE